MKVVLPDLYNFFLDWGWWCHCFFFFFLNVEISLHMPIPLFTPGLVHSHLASGDDCGWEFFDELCLSLFLCEVPTLCPESIVSLLWLHWVKCVCTFICNLWSVLLAEWLGSLSATVVTWGWNGHWIRVQEDKSGEGKSPTALAVGHTCNLPIASPL